MRDYAGLRIAVLFLLACSATWAGSPAGERADLAERFARRFMEGEHEQNLAMMTEVMKAASGREASMAEPSLGAARPQKRALPKSSPARVGRSTRLS